MHLTIDIADDLLITLKEQQGEFVKTMLFHHALMLYRKQKLSLGKAAELAGYDRLGFIQKLQFENEVIFDYETGLVNEMVSNIGRTLSLLENKP
jgi:predicted HTH domain antitoxin